MVPTNCENDFRARTKACLKKAFCKIYVTNLWEFLPG